ncbi:hypothetical protein [Bacillus sp. C28GYM-DRY-1]|nr:hypothetical protein [Bacillus sp. C28GYM-DRY-1]MDO3659634.1 hypothetical protein [Bacillus sp. C28GYM-DRY-1]
MQQTVEVKEVEMLIRGYGERKKSLILILKQSFDRLYNNKKTPIPGA